MKKTIFSGIQPSGHVTLGNYIGAMKQFLTLQETENCYFCVVDYHAITNPKSLSGLKEHIRSLAALYLASGMDPKKATIFVQSEVPAHTELGWMMMTHSYMGELERMTQFKDKSKGNESIPTGLFVYPPLMAADILLYDTTHVPIGDDQNQHLQLTRDLAQRMNHMYGEIFTIPEGLYQQTGSKVMSLKDPTKKMSKSDPSEKSYITLLDSEDVVAKKIKSAQMDSLGIVRYNKENQPGVSNMLEIYASLADLSIENAEKRFENCGYKTLKEEVTDVINATLSPIQQRYQAIISSSELNNVLTEGAEKAASVANQKVKKIKERIGLGK